MPRAKNREKRKIAVIDCETDPFKAGRVPKPFIWGFYDGCIYKEFYNEKDLIEYLKTERLIVYAHNGGKFDYHYILDFLEPFSDLTIINGRLAKFQIGECEFRDSYNILPVPLSAYQKTEIDYSKFEKEVRHKHMREIRDYLKDDCVFLYEFVKDFIDSYGVNLTLAGTALKQWRKISEKDVPESTKGFYQDFSPYYYGGRVECFEKGVFNGNYQSYDINSAYPFLMLQQHPYGLRYDTKTKNISKIVDQNFYTIKAKSDGCLPLRSENGLNFPCEENIFHVSGWEINAGLETNSLDIHDIIKEHEFFEFTDFKDYINHFYEMKKNAANNTEYLFAKLFMNSLYGKFAANPEKYSETHIVEKKFIDASMDDGFEFAGELGKWALMREGLAEEKQKYYNVVTAASITGGVRAYLWRNIYELRKNGFKPIYCDTDCIFFEGQSEPPLRIGCELGEWDREGGYSSGAVAGKKLYAFKFEDKDGYKTASKGCRLTGKQIFEIANGNEIFYEAESPIYSVFKEPRFLSRKIKKT